MNPATFQFLNSVTHPDEWDRAWLALRTFWRGDNADYNSRFGECWQYMGTELRGDTWEHVFRHRAHPRTNKREYWRSPASDAFHASNPAPSKPVVPRPYERIIPHFDPTHCGGAFDGVSVSSDAEGGL
jgi:hypothetical protein